jgi:hypothetical protein
MNAATCWGKNTIDPSGRDIEKPRKATLTFFYYLHSFVRMMMNFSRFEILQLVSGCPVRGVEQIRHVAFYLWFTERVTAV